MLTRSLVVLTLDEVEGTKTLMPAIVDRHEGTDIVAVDGGSTDGTVDVLRDLPGVRVCGQSRPGRGEAFRVAAAETSGDLLVFFSPDGNEDPADINRLFEALEDGADMAIASRFLPGASNEEDDDALPLRKWTNQAFTAMANGVWNRGRSRVSDTINGFRGITRTAFSYLAPTSLRFTIEYELTIGAMRSGMTIAEIPTRELPRLAGETKGPSLSVGTDFVRFFLGQVSGDLLGRHRRQRTGWPSFKAQFEDREA